MERHKDETIIVPVKNVSATVKNTCEHAYVQDCICTYFVKQSVSACV